MSSKLYENLRPISELDMFHTKGVIPYIESRGYECLGWFICDRSTFERYTECRMGFGDFVIYSRKSPDGNYLYKSFNTSYSRFGPERDQKSVIVFKRRAERNETDR